MLAVIALGFVVSAALLFRVLRMDGIRLSVPRRVLLCLGWLFSGGIFFVMIPVLGIGLFESVMGIGYSRGAPIAAGLGGLVLGSMVVVLMKAVVTGAGPKSRGKSRNKRG